MRYEVMRLLLFVSLVFASVTAGCESDPSPGGETRPLTRDQIVRLLEEQGVAEIYVYRSKAHGDIGTELVRKLTMKEQHDVVLQAIKTGEQIPGVLDTRVPDYDFVIKGKNNDSMSFHFWLRPDAEQGMWVSVRNTGVGYTLSKSLTQQLIEYVK
ncbi:hypothetical protein [Paenibacillus silviterrae]|uniref:hypothetical protein n=1 Tax=Paenibacillus silviterrae TaxID=3242194 RepID=UPI0025438FD0|nr:hypothetical protein [Paenibacillus chinjuensis]